MMMTRADAKWPCDDVVQSLMSGDSARRPYEDTRATGFKASARNMWKANVACQPQTDYQANASPRRRQHEASHHCVRHTDRQRDSVYCTVHVIMNTSYVYVRSSLCLSLYQYAHVSVCMYVCVSV